MSTSSNLDRVEGRIEGSIQIDTGKDKILAKIKRLESQLKQLSEETSGKSRETQQAIEQVAKDTAKILKELREEIMNKLREQESVLSTIRKTIAKVDSRQEEQTRKQRELQQTAEKLQDSFIFEERVLPGVKEVIRARDNVIGQLNDSEENDDNYIFYEALDSALENTLEEFNVTEVEPEGGSQFNSEMQEVVSEESTLQSKDDGKVVEILKPGYRRGDRLIRPQQVKISKFKGGTNE